MSRDVTVCIPTIPPRREWLQRALASVWTQLRPPEAVAVTTDWQREGVWVTRHRAHLMARTEWIANLDDDDEFLPGHLARLLHHAQVTGADYVYPWFETVPPGGERMLPYEGRPFRPAVPHAPLTTNTVLIRTELAVQLTLGPPNEGEVNANDDQRMVDQAVALGARIVHLPERTWRYHHHGRHTSGQPHRW